MVKIISKRNSFLERSITFEVNGVMKTVSAPASTTTFDDLIARIETEFGAASSKAGSKDTKEGAEPAEPEREPAATKTRKKSATSGKSAE